MKTKEMIKSLNAVAASMNKRDEIPVAANYLRQIAEHLEESRIKNNRQVDDEVSRKIAELIDKWEVKLADLLHFRRKVRSKIKRSQSIEKFINDLKELGKFFGKDKSAV